MSRVQFPKDFLWGVATSSFQIEGATKTDGRGDSIWDAFCRTPGKIKDRTNGDIACDHYHLWPQDIKLMKDLGIKAYRFSVAWPRIFPNGHGKLNPKGLDFYKKLVDGLLEAGIDPWLTAYHWDLPQVLQERGGWTNRDTAFYFAEYVSELSLALGDRVPHWITHNEPWCVSILSYKIGEHAPGHQNVKEALTAAHNLLLSHGLSVPIIRRHAPNAEVGITLNLNPSYAASASEFDQKEARIFDGEFNRWFLDPVFKKKYPKDIIENYIQEGHVTEGDLAFTQSSADLELIGQENDFLGINYYTRAVSRSSKVSEKENAPQTVFPAPKSEWTDIGWEIYPEGLHDTVYRVHTEYGPKAIYITENGAAYHTAPDDKGVVNDQKRVAYFRDHLKELHRAMDKNVPIKGYFAWSLMDNFEWAHGYSQRFGMVWVDYESQKRIPKASAYWYQKVIQENAID